MVSKVPELTATASANADSGTEVSENLKELDQSTPIRQVVDEVKKPEDVADSKDTTPTSFGEVAFNLGVNNRKWKAGNWNELQVPKEVEPSDSSKEVLVPQEHKHLPEAVS